MVDPAIEGPRIYETFYKKYDYNFGGSVCGISGSQGSVKTTVMLDLVEKKIENHPEEILFWRETIKSPMQCQRLLTYDFKIYAENNYDLKFYSPMNRYNVDLEIIRFNDIDHLFDIVQTGVLNVIFFKSKKKWTDLIDKCNIESNIWTTVFLDELEGLYDAGSNNQTDDRWWDWMKESGDVIKECRKSHTSLFGNYHDENLIDHRVKGKFMFYLYGFGAVVNSKRSRIRQTMVDGVERGEFCIASARNRFGKIKIKKYYPAIDDCLIPLV